MLLAAQEARRLHCAVLGPEHILLALCGEESGVAAYALENLHMSPARICEELNKLLPSKPLDKPVTGRLPHTPAAIQTVANAVEEARSLGHKYVGPEHLLLGLVQLLDRTIVAILGAFGITTEAVREEVLRLVGHSDHEPEQLIAAYRSLDDLVGRHLPNAIIATIDDRILLAIQQGARYFLTNSIERKANQRKFTPRELAQTAPKNENPQRKGRKTVPINQPAREPVFVLLDVSNFDWSVLQRDKMTLLNMAQLRVNSSLREALLASVAVLDYLQDTVVSSGKLSFDTVFGLTPNKEVT